MADSEHTNHTQKERRDWRDAGRASASARQHLIIHPDSMPDLLASQYVQSVFREHLMDALNHHVQAGMPWDQRHPNKRDHAAVAAKNKVVSEAVAKLAPALDSCKEKLFSSAADRFICSDSIEDAISDIGDEQARATARILINHAYLKTARKLSTPDAGSSSTYLRARIAAVRDGGASL